MSNKELQLDQQTLVDAWDEQLIEFLEEGDSSEVTGDVDPKAIRINIQVAGRSMYELDFLCTYVDTREVDVELLDVDRDDRSVDEHSTEVQEVVEEYVRRIHECAQALKPLTTASV